MFIGETSSVAAVRLFSAFGGLTAERLEAGLCAANRKRCSRSRSSVCSSVTDSYQFAVAVGKKTGSVHRRRNEEVGRRHEQSGA